jgi:hypothetical protein
VDQADCAVGQEIPLTGNLRLQRSSSLVDAVQKDLVSENEMAAKPRCPYVGKADPVELANFQQVVILWQPTGCSKS